VDDVGKRFAREIAGLFLRDDRNGVVSGRLEDVIDLGLVERELRDGVVEPPAVLHRADRVRYGRREVNVRSDQRRLVVREVDGDGQSGPRPKHRHREQHDTAEKLG
jgi:hypothetical protein